MSLAQILGHLRTGDVIIVRNGDASTRLRLPTIPGRADTTAGSTFDSRKLLRDLIAARKAGVKKK
jgi:hypothetical protein